MSRDTRKPKAKDFAPCGAVRLTQQIKIDTAMAIYLTLEALNESAPLGCDGLPMELMVAHADGEVSIQQLLLQTLARFKAPVPEAPVPEFEEGACGCGRPHAVDEWN